MSGGTVAAIVGGGVVLAGLVAGGVYLATKGAPAPVNQARVDAAVAQAQEKPTDWGGIFKAGVTLFNGVKGALSPELAIGEIA